MMEKIADADMANVWTANTGVGVSNLGLYFVYLSTNLVRLLAQIAAASLGLAELVV